MNKQEMKNLCSRKLWELLHSQTNSRMEALLIELELAERGHYRWEIQQMKQQRGGESLYQMKVDQIQQHQQWQ